MSYTQLIIIGVGLVSIYLAVVVSHFHLLKAIDRQEKAIERQAQSVNNRLQWLAEQLEHIRQKADAERPDSSLNETF